MPVSFFLSFFLCDSHYQKQEQRQQSMPFVNVVFVGTRCINVDLVGFFILAQLQGVSEEI